MMFVPVVDRAQEPLMPTSPARARRWIKGGKATPFWKRGVFCVRLNEEPSSRETQPVAVGIDPGSKKEGFTVKSAAYTYLNIQADAVTWVKKHVEQRRSMRRTRRRHRAPRRANRANRARGGLPPSTKARWQWKLRIARWLAKLYPISVFVVEDIKAKTTGKRRWDKSFSPLQIGKNWFYAQLEHLAPVKLYGGWETAEMREVLGLKKTGNKLAATFNAHCVDSWVLANNYTQGHLKPDNTDLLCVAPRQFHRRQLHRIQCVRGGVRRPFGGTQSMGFKRGSLVRHARHGLCHVGGSAGGKISLHRCATGKRFCQDAKPSDCKFLTYSSWRSF